MKHLLTTCAALALATPALAEVTHPMDGLEPAEYQAITRILRDAGATTEATLFPLIELKEPVKDAVLAWKAGGPMPERRAIAQFTRDGGGFDEALVNLTTGKIESQSRIPGQPMVLFTEFMGALTGALENPELIAGLDKRGIKPEQAFCLPLTAGNFLTEEYRDSRLMKVPCYVSPSGSNFYAKPIEGLYALYDIGKRQVISVHDTGALPVPTDDWGYTEDEVAKRVPLRETAGKVGLTQDGPANYKLTGNVLEWDMFRLHMRVDKRPGLVVSNLDVKDGDTWRSVLYQGHLSEVFVPYMDPSEGWYWRTYMDSGEYGFGLFLSPLTHGIDCPDYATYLPATIADDAGNPLVIPDAICVFERALGDPAWRHFEVFAQTPDKPVPAEGRPNTELVIRTASEVGNYDYLIDYRLRPNGDINIWVGASGLDAVKGAAATSMDDPTAKDETRHGTLIAPNLVAANHDHYFNFKLDFDIDQPVNHFSTMEIEPFTDLPADSPRKSMWHVVMNMPDSEMDARYKISTMDPKHFHISDPDRKGYLGHEPGWMIHHGNVAYGPGLDFANDPPMKRNAYIEYSVWNTVHDPERRYAGGKYPMQGDGSDTLAEWVKEDKPLHHADIVTWFTAGFHHVPRMEDWPVMSTEWKTVHIMPYNFFQMNPAITLRK